MLQGDEAQYGLNSSDRGVVVRVVDDVDIEERLFAERYGNPWSRPRFFSNAGAKWEKGGGGSLGMRAEREGVVVMGVRVGKKENGIL